MPDQKARNAAYMREYRKRKRQEIANKFPKKPPKTAAQRQKEYRSRKKLAMLETSVAGNSGNIPKTAAQRQKEYRDRKKQVMPAMLVAGSSGNGPKSAAQRQKEYRDRKKQAMPATLVAGNTGNVPKTGAQRQMEYRNRKKQASIVNNTRVINENRTSAKWIKEGKVMCYADLHGSATSHNNIVEKHSCVSLSAVVLHSDMDIVEVTPDLNSMNIIKEEPDSDRESESEYSQSADQFCEVKKEKDNENEERHMSFSFVTVKQEAEESWNDLKNEMIQEDHVLPDNVVSEL